MTQHLRSIAVAMLFVLALAGCATTGPSVPDEVRVIERVIEIDDKSKDDLYVASNSWMVDVFRSAESVVQFQDKDAGRIKGKFSSEIKLGIYYYRTHSTIDIEIQEGRTRIRIYDPSIAVVGDSLNGHYTTPGASSTDINERAMSEIRTEWEGLLESLEESLVADDTW